MAKAKTDIWTKKYVQSLAPDAASIPAAEKVLKKGGFGTVEPTGDGRGWWVVCRGLSGTYQVSVRRDEDSDRYTCECNCLSYKNPCKHALALLLYLVDHPELRVEKAAPKAAVADFETLLRSAFREPDDDTTRLVLADFLEENDQPDRAALIRLQCEISHLKSQSARYKEIMPVLKPLAEKLAKHIEPIPDGMTYKFHRGFVRLMAGPYGLTDAGALPDRFVNLFRDGWIETLVLPIYYGLDTFSLIEYIGTLDASQYNVQDDVLMALVTQTAEARATGRLAHIKVHASNRKALATLLRIQQGEEVDPSELGTTRDYYYLSSQSLGHLVQFGRFKGAQELYLQGYLSDSDVNVLLTADLSALRRLRLENWTLTREGIEVLAKSAAMENLTVLRLRWCGLRSAAVAALAKKLPKTLRTLDLSWNNIGKAGVAALLKAELPVLRDLVLTDCQLAADDKKKLRAKFKTKVKL